MIERKVQTYTTNESGQKIVTYQGQGLGERKLVIQKNGRTVSETYEVWDTIRYDDGTATFWTPNTNGSATQTDEGLLCEYTANYGTVYIGSGQIHPLDSAMEFDVVSETGRVSLSFFNSSQATTDAFEFNTYSNRGAGHWRIEMTNTAIKFYRDGVELTGSPVSVNFGNNPVRIGFVGINGTSATIKIANFKEYYI